MTREVEIKVANRTGHYVRVEVYNYGDPTDPVLRLGTFEAGPGCTTQTLAVPEPFSIPEAIGLIDNPMLTQKGRAALNWLCEQAEKAP